MAADGTLRPLVLHHLLGSPCRPDQARSLRAREPDFTACGFPGQDDGDDFRAKPLSPMMVDRRAQVFQFTSGCALRHQPRCVAGLLWLGRFPPLAYSPRHIVPTPRPIHVGKRVRLPEVSERHHPLPGFLRPRMVPRLVGEIDVQDVEDEDFSGVTVFVAGDLVFAGDVLGEGSFSSRAVLSSAARADFARSVADDPGCVADEVAAGVTLFGFEPEPCAFCWSRHLSLMDSI